MRHVLLVSEYESEVLQPAEVIAGRGAGGGSRDGEGDGSGGPRSSVGERSPGGGADANGRSALYCVSGARSPSSTTKPARSVALRPARSLAPAPACSSPGEPPTR